MPSYALVVNSAIQSEGPLPLSARRLDTQDWVMGLATAPVELVEACGYFPVVDAPRPADTPTTTWTRTLSLLAGEPTVVWVERAKTQTEIDNATINVNDQTIRDLIQTAIDNNTTALSNIATARTNVTTNVVNANAANIGQANTQLDVLGNVVVQLIDQMERSLRQRTGLEKLLLGGTNLLDITGT